MRTPRWYRICLGAAIASLLTAFGVVAFGANATSGVYGSRIASLLGVAAPLLVLGVLLTWLPSRRHVVALPTPGPAPGAVRTGRVVLVSAAVLLGAPALLAAMLLTSYGVFFAVHGISLVV